MTVHDGAAGILFNPNQALLQRLLAKSMTMVGLFLDRMQARRGS